MTPIPLARCLIAGLLAALAACPPALAASDGDGDVELLVRREASLSAAERADVRADAGVDFARGLRLADTEVVTVPAAAAQTALRALEADPDVRWAERNGAVAKASPPGDPYFDVQWPLQNTGQTVQGAAGTVDADIDAPEAWARSTGAGVTVAVIDSGIELAHPDLAGRLGANAGELGGGRESNGIDDDHNGLVDDWRGWDFVGHDNVPQDGDGHGTHVSGTIAAVRGNGIGISGVAPDARVLALRVLDDSGRGTWADVLDAMDYAGALGVRIANLSLGASSAVTAVADVAAAHPGTLYVVAAGNDGASLDSATYYPCEAAAVNIVCVGASDMHDGAAGFSNVGAPVDVFAPGVNVLSTFPGGYAYLDGTSMATPSATGTAALALALEPAASTAALRSALLDSADVEPALSGLAATSGRINANAAVHAILGAPADSDGDAVDDVRDACPLVRAIGRADGCPAAAAPRSAPAPAPISAPTPAPPLPTRPSGGAGSPVVKPAISITRVRLSRCRPRKPCGRRLTVSLRASAAARVTIAVERRICVKRRCRWTQVGRASTSASAAAATLRPAQLLTRGRYRVVARAWADGSHGDSLTRTFQVR